MYVVHILLPPHLLIIGLIKDIIRDHSRSHSRHSHKCPRSSSLSSSSSSRRNTKRRSISRQSFFSDKTCSSPRDSITQTISGNIEKEQRMDLSIQAKDNEFESKTTSTRKKSPSRIESFLKELQEEERMDFPVIIEEIFKLLWADKFPRKSVSDSSSQPQRPKLKRTKKEDRKSISLPQS